MSATGLVRMRWVKPLPGPVVAVQTMLAPIRRSLAFLVITVLLLEELLPRAAAVASSATTLLMPLYSRIRTSGEAAAVSKVTVRELAPAKAAGMFLAK